MAGPAEDKTYGRLAFGMRKNAKRPKATVVFSSAALSTPATPEATSGTPEAASPNKRKAEADLDDRSAKRVSTGMSQEEESQNGLFGHANVVAELAAANPHVEKRVLSIVNKVAMETIKVILEEAEKESSVFGIPIWPGSLPLKPENREKTIQVLKRSAQTVLDAISKPVLGAESPAFGPAQNTSSRTVSPSLTMTNGPSPGASSAASPAPETPRPGSSAGQSSTGANNNTGKGVCVPNVVEVDGEAGIFINGGLTFVPLPGGLPKSRQKRAAKNKTGAKDSTGGQTVMSPEDSASLQAALRAGDLATAQSLSSRLFPTGEPAAEETPKTTPRKRATSKGKKAAGKKDNSVASTSGNVPSGVAEQPILPPPCWVPPPPSAIQLPASQFDSGAPILPPSDWVPLPPSAFRQQANAVASYSPVIEPPTWYGNQATCVAHAQSQASTSAAGSDQMILPPIITPMVGPSIQPPRPVYPPVVPPPSLVQHVGPPLSLVRTISEQTRQAPAPSPVVTDAVRTGTPEDVSDVLATTTPADDGDDDKDSLFGAMTEDVSDGDLFGDEDFEEEAAETDTAVDEPEAEMTAPAYAPDGQLIASAIYEGTDFIELPEDMAEDNYDDTYLFLLAEVLAFDRLSPLSEFCETNGLPFPYSPTFRSDCPEPGNPSRVWRSQDDRFRTDLSRDSIMWAAAVWTWNSLPARYRFAEAADGTVRPFTPRLLLLCREDRRYVHLRPDPRIYPGRFRGEGLGQGHGHGHDGGPGVTLNSWAQVRGAADWDGEFAGRVAYLFPDYAVPIVWDVANFTDAVFRDVL